MPDRHPNILHISAQEPLTCPTIPLLFYSDSRCPPVPGVVALACESFYRVFKLEKANMKTGADVNEPMYGEILSTIGFYAGGG